MPKPVVILVYSFVKTALYINTDVAGNRIDGSLLTLDCADDSILLGLTQESNHVTKSLTHVHVLTTQRINHNSGCQADMRCFEKPVSCHYVRLAPH